MKKIKEKKRMLFIAAHPDDELLGCAGTIANFAQEGHIVETLIVAEGSTSRVEKSKKQHLNLTKKLKEVAVKAGRMLSVKKTSFLGLPDNCLDSLAQLTIIQKIENFIKKFKPDEVFTHFGGDLNIDHRIVFQSVITACRPLPESKIKKICVFETLSSTEWGFGNNGDHSNFNPNMFIDISKNLELKIKALKLYKMEMRKFPHPRSLEAVEYLAKLRGSQSGLEAAEAFKIIREVK